MGYPATNTFMRFIAFAPLWAGFVVNTLLFALLAWIVLVGPGWIMRWLRFDRGLCPACGYNLREQGRMRVQYMVNRGCPECGWRRESVG